MYNLARFSRYLPILKYLVSGAIAAAVNIAALTILVQFGHLHYVVAEVIAFILSFFANFFLQRSWTFDHGKEPGMRQQMFWYLILALVNLVGNISLLYFFVHNLHIWYPIAEAVAIALLAVISYFVCKYFIFVTPEHRVNPLVFMRAHYVSFFVVAAFLFTLFLSTYKLTESPPTWFDEGIIDQVAMNVALHGPHALLQIAPGQYESAAYTGTTSFPVTFPVAAAFHFFGVHLVVARTVMVVFILLFAVSMWLLARKRGTSLLAAAALWLVITFPPVYANGKNVLGEIPGLLFLALLLLLVNRIETKQTTWIDFLGAGALLGLVVATKPIFFLILAPAGIVFLCSKSFLTLRKVLAALVGFFVPMIFWAWVQFGGQTFAQILGFYANPYGANVSASIATNALVFIKQPEPFYALLFLLVWLVSFFVRIRAHERISRSEYIAGGFSLLVYLAFLRANGDYRYFFLGEVLALLYFPFNLSRLWSLLSFKEYSVARFFMYCFFAILIVFQVYECFSHSWIATHYQSQRTAIFVEKLGSLSPKASIFMYQAPDAPLFLPSGMTYYQYFVATPTVSIGATELPLIAQKVPDYILIPQKLSPLPTPTLTGYREIDTFNHYGLWQRM